MTDDEFLALEPPATLTALGAVSDVAEVTRLRQLYAARRGKLVDGTGDPARLQAPTVRVTGPFRDSRALGAWARGLCITMIAVVAASMIPLGAEYRQVTGAQSADVSWAVPALALLSVLRFLVFLACAVVVLIWLYRANANAHRLGARKLRFSPGWSIGSYFVPFVSYAVPFLAMRDLWNASVNPNGAGGRGAGLLPVWWGFWLAYNLAAVVAAEVNQFAESKASVAPTVIAFNLASDAAFLVAGVIFVRLLAQIQSGQLALHRGVAQADVFA
jgi:hypothetical protein